MLSGAGPPLEMPMPRCSGGFKFVSRALLAASVLATTAAAAATVGTARQAGPPAVNVDDPVGGAIGFVCRHEVQAQKLVGLSAAIAGAGGMVHTVHVGFEDREGKIEASDATMYRWASVSKPLTAVAAVQLAAEKKLDLDADVRELVPEFPDMGKLITTRLLLTHQGGIVHYSNGPVVRTKRSYEVEHPFESVILALDTFKDSPLVCEPGEKHSYSTHGYILAGAAVERAGGKPFAELVRTRISEPLGLKTLQPDYQWKAIPHRAVGYKKVKDGEAVLSTDTDVSWKLPGGGFISTVRDMAAFGAGMLGDKLVDQAGRERLWTAQRTHDGKATSYGLGWSVGKLGKRVAYDHSGSQEKTATFLLVVPEGPKGEAAVVVALMCNTEGAELRGLARALASMATGESDR